ncbi:MAG: hypothetical protein AABY83_10160 [Pseudomonadota bacterium]
MAYRFENYFISFKGIVTLTLAFCSAAANGFDGWDVSNLNARNSALKQDYFSMQDDYDIWVNPALLQAYPNRVYSALGTALFSQGDDTHARLAGGQLTLGPVNAGVYMGRPYTGVIQNTLFSPGLISTPGNLIAMTAPSVAVKNLLDLFLSMDLGIADAGLRVNINRYADQRFNPVGAQANGTSVNIDEQKVSGSDVNLVFGAALKSLPLDVSLSIGLPSFTNNYVYQESSTIGGTLDRQGHASLDDTTNIAATARMDVLALSKGLVRLSAQASRFSFKIGQTNRETTNGTATVDQTGESTLTSTELAGYATFLLKPSEKITLIASGGLQYFHTTYTTASTDKLNANPLRNSYANSLYHADFPARLGVEVAADGHWTLRGGASRNLYRIDRFSGGSSVAGGVTQPLSSPRQQTIDADPLVELALGIRYALDDAFLIDGTINKDILHTGSYLLSGVSDQLLTQISLIYKF